jgi:adenylate cyclase
MIIGCYNSTTESPIASPIDTNTFLGLPSVYIMKRARELVNAERCSLFLVDHDKQELYSKVAEGTEEIRFSMSTGFAGYVATSGEVVNITDAYKDPRFNEDIDKQTGYHTTSILCMPIYNHEEQVIAVTQLINKREGVFTMEDEETLKAFSIFCGNSLKNAQLYKQAIQSQYKTKALLDVAVALSSETNIQPLLRSIMKHARKLIKADRVSLFMLDPDNQELRSQIAEGTEEIRVPLKDGIVGYVASTGEEVAVQDAYKDPRFNPVVDKSTGTPSILHR